MEGMEFFIIKRNERRPESKTNVCFLKIDNWNDYAFITSFNVELYDKNGIIHSIGTVKIGFAGQTTHTATYEKLPASFKHLSDEYFSLGQDSSYYVNIYKLDEETKKIFLTALRDVVFLPELIDMAKAESVFLTSLLRFVSIQSIEGQYHRVLRGEALLTEFNFKFVRPQDGNLPSIELTFNVVPESKPSTNIHAIIGRNGSGKTTILDGMIQALINENSESKFFSTETPIGDTIDEHYFSRLASVSFSVFDSHTPHSPPQDKDASDHGMDFSKNFMNKPLFSINTTYFHIGLKNQDGRLKSRDALYDDFIESLNICLSQPPKQERWLKAIEALESDENFSTMQLKGLSEYDDGKRKNVARKSIESMSSGHAVVLLITTALVARVEEKTLVIIDEPEGHLHPPLLSAFIRSLSDLLINRNGVAIIATHSPVVLQEIPKSNVWKINRSGLATNVYRPEIETFGENVGILTREVFGLEVVKSGFHDMLVKSVAKGGSYEEIVNEYGDQLGLEARAILKVLVTCRDR